MPNHVTLADCALVNPPIDTSGVPDEAPVAFISMGSVAEGGGWASNETRPISDGRKGYTIFQRGDVIVAKIGVCFENGKVALLSDLSTEYGLGSTEFHVLRARPGNDPRFVYHWTRHSEFLRAGEASMMGSGRYRVPVTFFDRFQIVKINGETQKFISNILDTIDDSIIKTDQLITKIKLVNTGLTVDLFTFGLDNNGEIRKKSALRNTPHGHLPKNWKIKRLGSIFKVNGGKRLPAGHSFSPKSTDFRYLRVTDFFGIPARIDQLQSLEDKTFHILKKYEIHNGSIAVSIAGSIGRFHAFLNDSNSRVILTENAAKLSPKSTVSPIFYSRFLNSSYVQQQISLEIGVGGGVPKLALHRIQSLKIVEIPIEEQIAIAQKLVSIDAMLQTLRDERNKLSALRDGLRDDLLTGRVHVQPVRGAGE